MQALPLVSTIWGVVLFGEYFRSSKRTYLLLGAMLIMFAAGEQALAGSELRSTVLCCCSDSVMRCHNAQSPGPFRWKVFTGHRVNCVTSAVLAEGAVCVLEACMSLLCSRRSFNGQRWAPPDQLGTPRVAQTKTACSAFSSKASHLTDSAWARPRRHAAHLSAQQAACLIHHSQTSWAPMGDVDQRHHAAHLS